MGQNLESVLALAGPPSSGKSSVAGLLAAEWQAPVLAFGDYVRQEAGLRQLPTTRGVLQDLGQELLDEQGPVGFCRSVLATRGLSGSEAPAIWDGVRHPLIVNALQEIYAPAPVILAFLKPPEAARQERFADAAESEDSSVSQWEAHETESHLGELEERADVVAFEETPALAAASIKQFAVN
jgi:hypothetical protein